MSVYYPKVRATLQVVFDGFGGSDSKPTVIDLVPLSASVTMNGYNQADEYTITFDATLAPFTPEIIRTAQIDIYAYGAKQVNETPAEAQAAKKDANRIIAGLVDNDSITFDESGRICTMKGRDFTSLMLDKPVNPKVRFALDKPLDQVLQLLVDLSAGVKTVNDKGQILATGRQQFIKVDIANNLKMPTANAGKHATAKRGLSNNGKSTYWDAAYALCLSHGLICYFRGYNLVIDSPHVLDAVSRTLAPNVAYGRNLSSLSLERKMARDAVPQIHAISYDRTTRKQLVAKYPETKAEKLVPGINFNKADFLRVVVPGITDQAKLKEIARSRYYAMGRSEQTLTFTTSDLEDLDGASILGLRPGDAVKVAFNDLHLEDFKSLNSAVQRAAVAKKYGYSTQVAELIGRSYDSVIREGQPYYTRSVQLDWDVDNGISLTVSAVNFVSSQRDAK